VSLVNTLMEFLPTLLFFGWAYWLVSRQMRNMPGGFGGSGVWAAGCVLRCTVLCCAVVGSMWLLSGA
jgi:hypothetical protein